MKEQLLRSSLEVSVPSDMIYMFFAQVDDKNLIPVIVIYCTVRKKRVPGRIVVHDRSQVESQVLPRYFSHSSFASLRRQLNYFAFSRMGKGKQKGATYMNDQVYDLEDILNLKRRLPGTASPVEIIEQNNEVEESSHIDKVSEKEDPVALIDDYSHDNCHDEESKPRKKRSHPKKIQEIINSVVPVIHISHKKPKVSLEKSSSVSSVTTSSSLVSSTPPLDSPRETQITTFIDLTKPAEKESREEASFSADAFSFFKPRPMALTHNVWSSPTKPEYEEPKEEDILAGCSALLSLGWQK